MEDLVYESKIKVPYTWSVGETGSKFLKALKDEKNLLANKCSDTGEVFIPPKKYSPHTMKENTEWMEVSGRGEIQSFTERCYDSLVAPKDGQTLYALIKLEGVDQLLPHFIGETKYDDLSIGQKVEPVFKDDRDGHILDIKYFKPA